MDNPTGLETAHDTADATFVRTLSIIFLPTSALAAIGRFFGWPGQQWVEALLIALGLATTVVWLKRNLPLQNVLLAMTTLASLGFVALLAVEVSKPGNDLCLGLASAQAPALAKYLHAAAWALLLLNAQGVTRLLAARREKSPFYGLWILGLTSALVCGFQMGLEAAVDSISNKTWALKAVMVAGWYCFAFLSLALASPALLKRKPGPRVLSIEPVWVWIGLNLLAMATAAGRGLWTVAVFQGAVTALGAWPGLRALRIR